MYPRFAPFYLITAVLLTAQTPTAQPVEPTSQDSTASRRISSHIAAEILEKLPAYSSPVVKPAEPATETNDVVVLKKLIIYGTKRHDITERELATKTGLSALLLKRYPGASFKGQDPSLLSKTHNYAALMLAEDERLEHIADLTRAVDDLMATGNTKLSKDLQKEISRAFMRRTDWTTESMDRSANNNRR